MKYKNVTDKNFFNNLGFTCQKCDTYFEGLYAKNKKICFLCSKQKGYLRKYKKYETISTRL